MVRLRVYNVDTQSEDVQSVSYAAQKGSSVWVRLPAASIHTFGCLRFVEDQVESVSHSEHFWLRLPFDAFFWYLQYQEHEPALAWTVSFVDPTQFEEVPNSQNQLMPQTEVDKAVMTEHERETLMYAESEAALNAALFPLKEAVADTVASQQTTNDIVDGSQMDGAVYNGAEVFGEETTLAVAEKVAYEEAADDGLDIDQIASVIDNNSQASGEENVGQFQEPPSSELDPQALPTTPESGQASVQPPWPSTRFRDFHSAYATVCALVSFFTTAEQTNRKMRSIRPCRFAIEDMLDLAQLPRLLVCAIRGYHMVVDFGNLPTGEIDQQTFHTSNTVVVLSFVKQINQYGELMAGWIENGRSALAVAIQLLCYCHCAAARDVNEYCSEATLLALHKALLQIHEHHKSPELGLLAAVVAWCHDARKWFAGRNISQNSPHPPGWKLWECRNPAIKSGKWNPGLLTTWVYSDDATVRKLYDIQAAAAAEIAAASKKTKPQSDPKEKEPRSTNKRKAPDSKSANEPASKRPKHNWSSSSSLDSAPASPAPVLAENPAPSSPVRNSHMVSSSQNLSLNFDESPPQNFGNDPMEVDVDSFLFQADLWNANPIF